MYPLIDSLYVTLLLGALLLTLALRAVVAACRYWRGMLAGQRQLIDRINALLPQTQCGACGHEGCLPYARAIAAGQDINRCPPGGEVTILRLAELVNDYPRPLHPAHGSPVTPRVAFIREAECIGCTKCIRACPVDAILGGPKLMHTVIASECTGCDLCVEPCPVDCIDMLPLPTTARPHWVLPSEVRSPTFPLDASR